MSYTPYYLIPPANNPTNKDLIRYFTLLDTAMGDSSTGFVTLNTAQTITGAKVISPPTGTMLSIGGTANLNEASGIAHMFEVNNDASAYQCLRFSTYGTAGSLNGQNNVHWCRFGGTAASPTATLSGDTFMSFGFRGRDSSGTNTDSMASFYCSATQNWTSTARGMKFGFEITPDGAVGRVNALTIDGTGGVGSVNTFLPTNIQGTATNNNAPAGNVGEYGESVVANVVAPSNGQFKDATSVSLAAGDYDITVAGVIITQAAVTGDFVVGFSTTSGNSGTGLVYGTSKVAASYPATNSYDVPFCITGRLLLSGSATTYLKFLADYASGTGPQLTGALSWRRRR